MSESPGFQENPWILKRRIAEMESDLEIVINAIRKLKAEGVAEDARALDLLAGQFRRLKERAEFFYEKISEIIKEEAK